MSTSLTRVDYAMPVTSEACSPLQEGNRVLESIARQEAMPALLAFSEFRQQIQSRTLITGRDPDRDLVETERFMLDEVLQLICDRAQVATQADCIVVALAETSESKRLGIVCRAAAGPLFVARGVRLIAESEFLQDGLESGRTLRCDDGKTDARVELDFAHHIGARSTVLVPLRGRRQQLGVLQAFSTIPRGFNEEDIRYLELFAELVLSALKPDDQNRRIHWLADVAAEILQRRTTADLVKSLPSEMAATTADALETAAIERVKPVAELPPAQAITEEIPEAETKLSELSVPATAAEIAIPVIELPREIAPVALAQVDGTIDTPSPTAAATSDVPEELFSSLPTPPPIISRPIVKFMAAVVAVAALFSAGAWWGMQSHRGAESNPATKAADINTPPPPISTPEPPRADVLMPVAADNLMSPAMVNSASSALTAVSPEKLAALPKITGVRHWSSSLGSTVVIDMQDQVPYEVHRLMSPERIYFDLHDTILAPDLNGKTMDVGDVALSRVRVAQPVAGLTRIVLDTRDGSNFSVSMESNPYRLVVELRGTEKILATTAKPTAPPRSAPAVKTPTVEPLIAKASGEAYPLKTGKLRIVLDAGHGGWDLGTVGRQGLLEKDLVLDVTQRLGKLLQTRLGSEVMFTREGDNYLSLDQRANFADQAQADLFVSIHANYSSSTAARGVETYYTNLFSAPGSRELEKHDDGSLAKLTPVSLSAGGLHEKIEESRKLAASVQRSLYATLAAKSPDIRNRGIKDSAFVVLTGTTMPSILTEISFVSSPTDEHNLQSATYRQQIAEALYQGIARYHQTSPHTKVAQLQTTSASR